MKRMMMILAMIATMVVSASATSLSKARTEALFLSDKMAYVLNLSDDQYNAVYEINLDYILRVNGRDDVYGYAWEERNSDLRYVLTDYQYTTYLATAYFYRPLNWSGNQMVFVIHNRYPENRYYRSAPRNYSTYKGGNRSYSYSAYQGRTYSENRSLQPRQQVTQQPTLKKSQAVREGNNAWKNQNSNKNSNQRTFGNQNQNSSKSSTQGQRSAGNSSNSTLPNRR